MGRARGGQALVTDVRESGSDFRQCKTAIHLLGLAAVEEHAPDMRMRAEERREVIRQRRVMLLPGGRRYLQDLRGFIADWRTNRPRQYIGHNPLGRLSVLALISS